MTSIPISLSGINFKDTRTVSRFFKKTTINPTHYPEILKKARELGPKKGKLLVKGLLRSTPAFKDRQEIIISSRKSKDLTLRRQVVRAFRESKADMELITGFSIMTRRDATTFFQGLFRSGGNNCACS